MKTFFVKFWRLIFPIKNEAQAENTDVVIEPIEITENLQITVESKEVLVKKQVTKKAPTKKAAAQKAPAKKTTNKKNK